MSGGLKTTTTKKQFVVLIKERFLHKTSTNICSNYLWRAPGTDCSNCVPGNCELCQRLALLLLLDWSAITEVSGERSSLCPSLPQPSLLYKCQPTTTDTDGEQKHGTGKGREPPTGVRKQEDSTHTVQERILPDNIINSFILNFFGFDFFFDFFILSFFSTFF